jgi:TPR repeat protein
MALRSTALHVAMPYVSLFACGAALLIHRARRRQKEKTASSSGGPFATKPREILVTILKYFTIYEVARLQRLVCREFREAGQERIHERGGRKLYEEGKVFLFGLDHKTIDQDKGRLLLQASYDAGCKTTLVEDRMVALNLSDEDKQKILKDLKEITASSPYDWVDYYIGLWYQKGWGGEEKKNQAVKWYEKAARKGNTTAMSNLGVCYANGDLGLTQSDTKANELYALAADKGHSQARFILGYSYRLGKGDLAIDFNRCVELWEQSATQGDVDAQASLGEMYRLGSRDGPPMTIPVDPQLSFRWNLAAANQEDVEAMNNIGFAYHTGRGVEQNDESAFEWSMKAAEKGKQNAQYMIGMFYEFGRGCEMDLVHAMHWYQKSAAQEYQYAMDAVARLS